MCATTQIVSGDRRIVWCMSRSLLRRNRHYCKFAASSAVSGLGDWMFGLALAVWVLNRTGSPAWVAVSVGVRLVPFAVLGPVGGVVADRFERRRILVTFDAARAILVGLLAVVVVVNGPVLAVVALATLLAVATTPYRPAVVAAVPSVVDEKDLAAANAIEAAIFQTLMFAGPALSGVLLRFVSPAAVFAIDGATFVASAFLMSRLPMLSPRTEPAPKRSAYRDEFRVGFNAARALPGVGAMALLIGVSTFAFGTTMVMHLVFVERHLALPGSSAGFLAATSALGGLAATGVARRLDNTKPASHILVASALLTAGSMLALSCVGSLAFALLAVVPNGLGTVLLEITGVTALQRAVPSQTIGRVFGVVDAIGGTGQVAGAVLAPLLITVFGAAGCFAAVGLAVAIAALTLARRLHGINDTVSASTSLQLAASA